MEFKHQPRRRVEELTQSVSSAIGQVMLQTIAELEKDDLALSMEVQIIFETLVLEGTKGPTQIQLDQ